MFLLIWIALCIAAAFLLLLPLGLWRREIFRRYSGSRLVACPENHKPAAVSIDLSHAAATGLDGCPELRLGACTRWPEMSACDRACLPQARDEEAYAPPQVKLRNKQIYHLPVFAAAFAAWCLGAIWHSQYLFRTPWMHAVGLTHAQVKELVWWFSPHVLTGAVCLLFAYGVASLLAICHRKGVLQGVLMAVLLAGAVAASSCYGIAKMPRDLLAIEAGYAALATLFVGAILGGLYNKLALPSK